MLLSSPPSRPLLLLAIIQDRLIATVQGGGGAMTMLKPCMFAILLYGACDNMKYNAQGK
jgi:hypothetical protein